MPKERNWYDDRGKYLSEIERLEDEIKRLRKELRKALRGGK